MKFTFAYGLVPVEFVPPSGMQHAADYAGVAAAVWEQAASDAARNIAMTIWPIFDRQNPTLDRTRDKLTDADFQ